MRGFYFCILCMMSPVILWGQTSQTELLWRQAITAMELGQPQKALYPLITLEKLLLKPDEKLKLNLMLGALYYDQGMVEDSIPYFIQANIIAPLDIGALRLAEWYLLHKKNHLKAQEFLWNLKPLSAWSERDKDLLSLLKKGATFQTWDLALWGLSDGNISALVKDYDDLWIGTWNGGLVRYSTITGEVTTFRNGEYRQQLTTIRTIAVDDWFVYIGGFEGLWRYNKVSGQWLKITPPEGFPLERIQDLIIDGRKLIVATLGAGIWEWSGGIWKNWERYGWTQANVNTIDQGPNTFYISTMDAGGWIFSPGMGIPVKIETKYPGITAKNLTFILRDSEDLWIGTYGNGLYRWVDSKKTWIHWSTKEGSLLDDYILSATLTSNGLIAGTLGRGTIYFSRKKNTLASWDPLIRGGPADIGVVVTLNDKVLFGTLGEGLVMMEERSFETELP